MRSLGYKPSEIDLRDYFNNSQLLADLKNTILHRTFKDGDVYLVDGSSAITLKSSWL